MHDNDIQKIIASGKTALGIELGSTRIKAVLIGEDHSPFCRFPLPDSTAR